jgi:hypothetical protein
MELTERGAEQSELIDHIEELGLEEFDGFVIAGVEVVEREVEDLAGGVVTGEFHDQADAKWIV